MGLPRMTGWLILFLIVGGGGVFIWSITDEPNERWGDSADERMGRAFIGIAGLVAAGLGFLILVGAGIWSLM